MPLKFRNVPDILRLKEFLSNLSIPIPNTKVNIFNNSIEIIMNYRWYIPFPFHTSTKRAFSITTGAMTNSPW